MLIEDRIRRWRQNDVLQYVYAGAILAGGAVASLLVLIGIDHGQRQAFEEARAACAAEQGQQPGRAHDAAVRELNDLASRMTRVQIAEGATASKRMERGAPRGQ